MSEIDKQLLNFDNCDIFTPEKIANIMQSYLHNNGTLLDPSVGTGNLLNGININDYDSIDVYDIKQQYLDDCNDKFNKYNEDFLKSDIKSKYNNIILNPPYIKIQNLSDEYRKFIKTKFNILKTGNIDIYQAFIIKCLDLLEDDGVMVSITPNSYLYNKSCIDIREYLFKNRYIYEIIDYGSEKVFDGISVYCCITIFKKKNNESLIYNNENIFYKDIVNNSLFDKNTENNVLLKTICKVSNGIATLRDKIYIKNEKLYDEPCWKPIYKNNKTLYIIYPYHNGNIIDEDTFKQSNPKTYDYLLENKDELAQRDKGKQDKYASWYAYGRTQSIKLNEDIKRCLFIPTFTDPKNIEITESDNMLHMSSIKIELLDTNYTLDNIKDAIQQSTDYIEKISSKRGGGWININTSTINKISI